MTITSVGASGTGASSTAGTSFTLATATNSFAAGDFAILRVVTDNVATTDGASTNHTSVTGWTGTVTKLGEQTNTVGGAAGDGATVSLWLLTASATIATGTTLTINHSSTTDRAAALHKFTKSAGSNIIVATGSTVQRGTADATATAGSLAISGLSSAARLYVRAIGVEGNSTTNVTVSTNFTALASARSRNNASAVYTAGEFRINTSTGETSAPTLPTASDSASLFIALDEQPRISGTVASTTADDTLSSAAKVKVTAQVASTTADDTLASTATLTTPSGGGSGSTTLGNGLGVTYLDPSNKSPYVTLSNGNLTATGNASVNAAQPAKSTTSHATGKYYIEFKFGDVNTSGNGIYFGVCNAAQSVTDFSAPGASNSNGFALRVDGTYNLLLYASGLIYNGGNPYWATGIAPGDMFMLAIDQATGKVWVGRNGTWLNSGDPVAGTGYIATVSLSEIYGYIGPQKDDYATINLGASPFTYTTPSGFDPWVINPLPTFNPYDKSQYAYLKDGALTVYGTATTNFITPARSTTSHTTGKYYIEFKSNYVEPSTDGLYMGICSSAQPMSGGIKPGGDNSYGLSILIGADYSVYLRANSSFLGTVPYKWADGAAGDMFMLAYDCATGKVWVGQNGTWFNSGNPAAGTGSVATLSLTDVFAFIGPCWDTTSGTANLGATAFAYTPPSGFSPWATNLATTLDPNFASPYVTLSNNNLSVQINANSAIEGVRSTTGKTTGKWYYEMVQTGTPTNGGLIVGIVNPLYTNPTAQSSSPGRDSSNGAAYANGGYYQFNGNGFGAPYLGPFGDGDIVMMAVDATNDLFYVGLNGTWLNGGDPVAGTGGVTIGGSTPRPLYAWAGVTWDTGTPATLTARFKPTAQTYAAPSGFTAWDAGTYTPPPTRRRRAFGYCL